MGKEICVNGFGMPWDGVYTIDFVRSSKESQADLWVNTDNTYWVWRNAFKWIITSNPHHVFEKYIVAEKMYDRNGEPALNYVDGNYTGVNGNPNGNIKLGVC